MAVVHSRDGTEARIEHGNAVTMMMSTPALGWTWTEIAAQVIGCLELPCMRLLLIGGKSGQAGRTRRERSWFGADGDLRTVAACSATVHFRVAACCAGCVRGASSCATSGLLQLLACLGSICFRFRFRSGTWEEDTEIATVNVRVSSRVFASLSERHPGNIDRHRDRQRSAIRLRAAEVSYAVHVLV